MNRRILLTTDVVGGVWDFCLSLASGLRAAGDDVVLLALGSPSQVQRHAAAECGAHLVGESLKLEWMSDSEHDIHRTPRVVEQVAREAGADIVHANQFAAACVDLPVPVVLTVHSDVLSWRSWTLGASDVPPEWRLYRQLVREAVTRADSVVAVSTFLAGEVGALYGIERPIEVIHNGWPPPERDSTSRQREPLTVVAGRIWDAAKNIALVARAAEGSGSDLDSEFGEVLLAGERTHPDGGEAVVPSPLKAIGLLERAELDDLLGRASVYISPARYDPFGLLPLQAALHGCKLLLSDIPSYREVWDGAARFFRSDDVDDLRRQWRIVLNEPHNADTLQRAGSYSLQRMLERYRNLYARTRHAVAA